MSDEEEPIKQTLAKQEDVFAVYASLNEPSIERARDLFLKQNLDKKVSYVTCKRWAVKYKWVDRVIEMNPGRPHKGKQQSKRRSNSLKTSIKQHMKYATPETIKALQGKILDKMHTELALIELDTTGKFGDMLEIVGKMQELEHEFRGSLYTNGAAVTEPETSDDDDPPESPVVNFKKVANQVRKNSA